MWYKRAISCVLIGALVTTAAWANSRDLRGQVYKLLSSGDQKKWSRGKHDFKLKTVVFQPTGTPDEYYVDGRLTHDIRFRPDDVFHFCTKMNRDGDLLEFKTAIKRGGFTSMLNRSYRLVNNRAVSGAAGRAVSEATGRSRAVSPRTGRNLGQAVSASINLKSVTAQGFVSRIGQGFGTAIEGDWVPAASEATAEIVIQSSAALRTGRPRVEITRRGGKIDEAIINRCPRRTNRSLH